MGAYGEEGKDPHRSIVRWMIVGALFTLVQGALLLVGAALGLALYTCALNISGDVYWQMVRLYYFSNVNCIDTYLVNGTPYTLDGANDATLRTMITMSIYSALCSILVVGSLFLLGSAIKGKQMYPVRGKYLHYPWVISMTLLLVVDLVAAVLYCTDLIYTSDFSDLSKFLNIKLDGKQPLEDRNIPPIIMALLTSKGVVLWAMDTALVIYLHKQFKRLFVIREEAEFERAQLSSIPENLWSSRQKENLSSSKDSPLFFEPTQVLPRLMVAQNGKVVGDQNLGKLTTRSTVRRSSALQIAARQGFSYERPPSSPWITTLTDGSPPERMPITPRRNENGVFSYDTTDNWYRRSGTRSPSEFDRSSNILQRNNDVFY